MKNSILSALAILLITSYFTPTTCIAQAPQGIPYQAIARNASGVAIANTAVKVRFSIRDSIATGAIKYQETHSPMTSALGLFSVNVGMGTVVSGTFSGINWGKNAKFLQVELNTTGGTNYTDLGTTQMMSVPYALQANGIKMKVSISGDTLYSGKENFLIVPGISSVNPQNETLVDIDGNIYNTVKIGSQIWMKENLEVGRYNDGEPLVYITGSLSSSNIKAWILHGGSFCFQDNSYSNNSIYGKLYNLNAAVYSNKICPTGWHVPSINDWLTLANSLGGIEIAGKKLKSTSSLWSNPSSNSNESGFSALPGGGRNGLNGFYLTGDTGNWWTTDNVSGSGPQKFVLTDGGDGAAIFGEGYNSIGCYIRCLKN